MINKGDLISRSALKEVFNQHEDNKGYLIGDWEEYIDNAPTVEPTLSDEQIDKITDLLETEWGYEGIREDVSRILRGERQ